MSERPETRDEDDQHSRAKATLLLVISLNSRREKRPSWGFRRLFHKHVVHLCSFEGWTIVHTDTDLVWENVLGGLKDSTADVELLF